MSIPMAKFKDYLNSDLSEVFFNDDEFADPHTIGTRQLNIIIDNDRLMYRSKKEFDGITVGEILYFVKASDYGPKPKEGEPQIFDGRNMQVFDVREDDGMYEIILHQNRGV
jgi:hypothetical protein